MFWAFWGVIWTLFSLFSGQKWSKWSKNSFFVISSNNHFQKGVIWLCSITFYFQGFSVPREIFYPSGPIFGPIRSKWPKIIFFLILGLNDFKRGVTCLCLGNMAEKGIFGPKITLLGPKSGFRDFSAKIRLCHFFTSNSS